MSSFLLSCCGITAVKTKPRTQTYRFTNGCQTKNDYIQWVFSHDIKTKVAQNVLTLHGCLMRYTSIISVLAWLSQNPPPPSKTLDWKFQKGPHYLNILIYVLENLITVWKTWLVCGKLDFCLKTWKKVWKTLQGTMEKNMKNLLRRQMAGLCLFLLLACQNLGGSAMGFEGFILGFSIYMTHKKNFGPKKSVQTT